MSIDTARRVLEAIKKYRAASDADSGDEENAAANELADAADAHLVDESSRYVALAELVDEYQSEPDTEISYGRARQNRPRVDRNA